jgi:putative addiction module CopG family antidote
MTIKLNAEMKKIVDEKLKGGHFASAEEVVFAGLRALRLQQVGDFEAGELKQLIAEGDESIEKDGTIDLDQAFAEIRTRRVQPKARR